MHKFKRPKMSVTDMIEQFENFANAQNELLGNHDVKGANLAHDKLMKLSAKIRTMEDGGEQVLMELIHSKHDAVRSTAAYLMLPLRTELASQELLDIANNASNIFLASSARTCLEEWIAGRLDTDWFIKKYGPKSSNHLN